MSRDEKIGKLWSKWERYIDGLNSHLEIEERRAAAWPFKVLLKESCRDLKNQTRLEIPSEFSFNLMTSSSKQIYWYNNQSRMIAYYTLENEEFIKVYYEV